MTNVGDQGVDAVFGVIYPPQVALVSFGKPAQRVCAVDGAIHVMTTVLATLPADHGCSDDHRGRAVLPVDQRADAVRRSNRMRICPKAVAPSWDGRSNRVYIPAQSPSTSGRSPGFPGITNTATKHSRREGAKVPYPTIKLRLFDARFTRYARRPAIRDRRPQPQGRTTLGATSNSQR